MEILLSTTSHAAILLATGDRGDQRAVAAIPVILEGPDSPVRDQAITLKEAVASFAPNAANIVATYTATARVGQLRIAAVKTLALPMQRFMGAGQAEARATDATWARLLTVPAADATTAMLRQEDRATFGLLAIGDKAAWIGRANVDRLGAIIEGGGDRANVTPEIWDHAENRYAALNFIRMAGTAADYARQPTVDDPLATGVDMAAAERAANEGLDRHRQRSEIIDAVEQAVQGITNVVALTCEMDVRAAFTMLTTGKVPE
jgi:hypothetical protein